MPYKKVDITGEGTEVVDGGRGTPVDVVQEPTNELEKADTRFIASDKAPKKTVVDSDLQVLGKYYDKDGNEIGGGSGSGLTNPVKEDLVIDYSPEEETISGFKESYRLKFENNSDNVFMIHSTDNGDSSNPSTLYIGEENDSGKMSINLATSILNLEAEGGFKRNIAFFTPATTGRITKTEAEGYVQKIVSGELCVVIHNCFKVSFFDPNAGVGSIYLILTNTFASESYDPDTEETTIYGNIESIIYTVNSGLTLDTSRKNFAEGIVQ